MDIYQVKKGDTVSIIARDVLGDVNRWPDIAKLNNLVAPYTIFEGSTLLLPKIVTIDPVVIDRGLPTTTPPSTPARVAGAPFQMTPQVWLLLGMGALFWFLSMDGKK